MNISKRLPQFFLSVFLVFVLILLSYVFYEYRVTAKKILSSGTLREELKKDPTLGIFGPNNLQDGVSVVKIKGVLEKAHIDNNIGWLEVFVPFEDEEIHLIINLSKPNFKIKELIINIPPDRDPNLIGSTGFFEEYNSVTVEDLIDKYSKKVGQKISVSLLTDMSFDDLSECTGICLVRKDYFETFIDSNNEILKAVNTNSISTLQNKTFGAVLEITLDDYVY